MSMIVFERTLLPDFSIYNLNIIGTYFADLLPHILSKWFKDNCHRRKLPPNPRNNPNPNRGQLSSGLIIRISIKIVLRS